MGQVALFYANSPKTSNITLDVAKKYTQKAEEAFKKALENNDEYIRPHIGLGSVYLTRSEWYYDEINEIDKHPNSADPNRRAKLEDKRDEELNKAIASYDLRSSVLAKSFVLKIHNLVRLSLR